MTIRHVAVAIPAKDEQELIGDCLRSVLRAGRRLRLHDPSIRVDVAVALDRCIDGTAGVVAQFADAGVRAVVPARPGVGQARDAAVRAGVAAGPDVAAENAWIACTDADSIVPTKWLITQVALANRGMDLVLGTVAPGHGIAPAVLARWHAEHDLTPGHGHVHGANLGVRASAYVAAGGFGSPSAHEDVGFSERVKASGLAWAATNRVRVTTSARLTSRVDQGFAAYLVSLGAADSAAVDPAAADPATWERPC